MRSIAGLLLLLSLFMLICSLLGMQIFGGRWVCHNPFFCQLELNLQIHACGMLVSLCCSDETKRRASSEKARERKTVCYPGAWNRLNVNKTLSCLHSCSSSRFNMDGDQIPRSNFDSFWRAVITVFQVRKRYRCIFVWSFFSSRWQKEIRGAQLDPVQTPNVSRAEPCSGYRHCVISRLLGF